MSWTCLICGVRHDEIPICFGIDAPWRAFVPEDEFERRVELMPSLCVIDKKIFFARGHIEIPILDYPEILSFSVWSSLSEKSFRDMNTRWDDADRASSPPYFGWLSSPIIIYPNTINLKLSVQSRPTSHTPLFTVGESDHPLYFDQRNGISVDRWHAIAHQLLHV